MARGRKKGCKKTGGRQKGKANAKTRAIAEQALAEGITPLQVMVRTMRLLYTMAEKERDDEKKLHLMRSACEEARGCAPFMHPRLAAVTHGSDPANPLTAASVTVNFIGVEPKADGTQP